MTQTNPLVRKFAKGASYLKRHGGRMTTARLLQGLGNQIANSGKGKGKAQYPLGMLVKFSDAAALDWVSEPHWKKNPRTVGEGPFVTAWIMSPPGESSGGHQNIFRFLSYLEAAGHTVKIFLYWSQAIPVDADRVREMVERSRNYPSLQAAYALYEAAKKGKFLSKDDLKQRAKGTTQTAIDKMTELGIINELPNSSQISLFDFMG